MLFISSILVITLLADLDFSNSVSTTIDGHPSNGHRRHVRSFWTNFGGLTEGSENTHSLEVSNPIKKSEEEKINLIERTYHSGETTIETSRNPEIGQDLRQDLIIQPFYESQNIPKGDLEERKDFRDHGSDLRFSLSDTSNDSPIASARTQLIGPSYGLTPQFSAKTNERQAVEPISVVDSRKFDPVPHFPHSTEVIYESRNSFEAHAGSQIFNGVKNFAAKIFDGRHFDGAGAVGGRRMAAVLNHSSGRQARFLSENPDNHNLLSSRRNAKRIGFSDILGLRVDPIHLYQESQKHLDALYLDVSDPDSDYGLITNLVSEQRKKYFPDSIDTWLKDGDLLVLRGGTFNDNTFKESSKTLVHPSLQSTSIGSSSQIYHKGFHQNTGRSPRLLQTFEDSRARHNIQPSSQPSRWINPDQSQSGRSSYFDPNDSFSRRPSLTPVVTPFRPSQLISVDFQDSSARVRVPSTPPTVTKPPAYSRATHVSELDNKPLLNHRSISDSNNSSWEPLLESKVPFRPPSRNGVVIVSH